MDDKIILIMACACKNKANKVQATKVKQVVKSKNVTPSATMHETTHKVTKRVIYRRSV